MGLLKYLSSFGPYLLTSLVVLYFARVSARYLTYRRLMLKYDCSPPRKYPHKDPFFGLDMFLKFAKAIERGNLLPTVENYFSEFGKTFQSTAFGTTIINTMDPRVVQSVLATEFDKFGVAPTRKSAFGPLIRDGIFTLDGASWVHSRAMLKPIFSGVRVSSIDNIKEHVDRLLQLIPRNSETIDLQPLLKRLFLDKSIEFLFGVSQDSLLRGSSDETSEDFISAFDCVLQGLNARYFLGPLSFLLGREKKLKADIAQVHGFVDQYVEMAIRRRKEIMAGIPLERSLRYVLLDELVSTTSDKNELRNQALNLFLPARDTTASAISFIFFHLARNPRVWEKLRDEVMEISDIPLTFDILKTMKYLKHVINESLRLLAPAGLSIRTCTQDCVLPYGGGTSGQSPLFVQKGTEIRIVFHAMHKDSDFWGEEALRFRPERWEGMRTTWGYIPFLGGGRICPAQQMVLVECSYLVARFVQSFTGIENRDEEVEFVERHKMQMESRNGVKVAFRV